MRTVDFPLPPSMQWVEFVAEILGTDPQISSLSGLSYSGNADKVVAVNAAETGFELVVASGSGGGLSAAQAGARAMGKL